MMGIRKVIGDFLGPTGRAAKITSITSEAVPATEPSSAVVGGTDLNRTLHLKLQQGMPAAEAMPQDVGVAGFVAAPGSATRTALLSTIAERRTFATVGADGDYPTITDALTARPGNITLELMGGVIVEPGPLPVAGISDVTIRGQGRDSSVVETPAAFIDAPIGADMWSLRDFGLRCTAHENTYDGIKVDYARRWAVRGLDVRGFGGTSIWFRGGIQSSVEENYIFAKDAANVNGFAGVRVDKATNGAVPTTFLSRRNYVGTGKQYGFHFKDANVGSVFDGDIVEYCAVGMRFELCMGELHSPYTEGNGVGIEEHDSGLIHFGRFRDMPVTTWSALAQADRRTVSVGERIINVGKGLIFGPQTGPVTDPSLHPSITWGNGAPEGARAGVLGSVFIRTDGADGTILYAKTTASGNTGWQPVGPVSRPTSSLTSAAGFTNTQDKFEGKQVFNRTTKRPVWAAGPLPTDVWLNADGTTAHTPA